MNEVGKKVIENSYLNNIPQPKNTEVIIEEVDTTAKEVKRILDEAKNQADEILYNAKIEAGKLVKAEEAKIEEWWQNKREEDKTLIEQFRQEAYNEGYQEGYKSAEEDVYNQYHDFIAQSKQFLQEAYDLKEHIIQESDQVIIELSVEIAKKIIKKEINDDSTIPLNMIKEILKETKETERISIFVCPDDFAYIHSARLDLLRDLNGQIELSVYPDPSIEEGGTIIRTSNGTLDAKIDTQLEEIKNILMGLSGGTQ